MSDDFEAILAELNGPEPQFDTDALLVEVKSKLGGLLQPGAEIISISNIRNHRYVDVDVWLCSDVHITIIYERFSETTFEHCTFGLGYHGKRQRFKEGLDLEEAMEMLCGLVSSHYKALH